MPYITAMNEASTEAVGKWLKERLWEIERESGHRIGVAEHARRIGIPKTTFVQYLNADRHPRKRAHIDLIAAYVGGEFYDLLGLARPIADADLQYIVEHWREASRGLRNEVLKKLKQDVNRR